MASCLNMSRRAGAQPVRLTLTSFAALAKTRSGRENVVLPMNRIPSAALVASWLWFAATVMLPPAVYAAAVAGDATLTGVVTNSATGRTLEGARVVLQGTGREAFTDSQGVYRF